MPIWTLRPNPRNARTHSKKQLRQIADSIKAFGFINPVIVDNDNTVLAGHGRLEAARIAGLTHVRVIRFDHLTPAQKRAYLIADNKIVENAGWDFELLAPELGELADLLPTEGLEVSVTGFEPAEIDLLFADRAPGLIQKTLCRLCRKRPQLDQGTCGSLERTGCCVPMPERLRILIA